MADEKIKISALAQGSPAENDIIPFVDLATNTTKKALKSELKGVQGDAATVDAGATTTLAAGESATVTNVGTTAAAIFNFAIPQGIQGLTGADGACVESVAFVGNDMVFILDDTSTVTLTNAKTDLKGDTGLTGAKITSASFVGDDLVFVLDDTSTVTVTGAKTTLKGDTGNPGADGDAATIAVGTVTTVANNVPASVTNSGTSAAAIFDFEIPKGLDGTGSGDITGSGTANELAYFTAEKTIDNLPVATYPNLTEVSYVKGVTSDIQTQLNGKQASGSYEVTTNKENSTIDTSTTKYPTVNLLKTGLDAKASLTGTETLTNKRINPRLVTATSYTTDTGTSLDVSTCDQFEITAQAGDLKFNNPSGTPVGGQKLIIRIKDNGTARALTYDTQFRAMGNALPSTTVVNKTLYMGFIWNATDSKFDLVAVANEA